MNFDLKAIALNVLTLGFTGAKASNQTIERIKKKRSIPVISQIAVFLYFVPIYGWISFFVGTAALIGYEPIPELVEDFGGNPAFVISGAFFTFSLIHLVLGTAILQHLKEQKEGHRAKIIWFGCYGLKWDPLEHLKEDDLERGELVNTSSAAGSSENYLHD